MVEKNRTLIDQQVTATYPVVAGGPTNRARSTNIIQLWTDVLDSLGLLNPSSQVHIVSAAPSNSVGGNGDLAVWNRASGMLDYIYLKVSGSWVLLSLDAGINVSGGTAAPSGGTQGDIYIQDDNGVIRFHRRGTSTWTEFLNYRRGYRSYVRTSAPTSQSPTGVENGDTALFFEGGLNATALEGWRYSNNAWSRIGRMMATTTTPSGFQAPTIDSLTISGLQESNTAPYTIRNQQRTITFTGSNLGNVQGNLSFLQGSNVLTSSVDPSSGSFTVNTRNQTLQHGQSVGFRLQGTDTEGNAFGRDFVVSAAHADPTLEWRSFDLDNSPGSGSWNMVTPVQLDTDIDFQITVDTDNDGWQMRVPLAYELTRIQTGAAGFFVTEYPSASTNVTVTTDATHRIYQETGLNPLPFNYRVRVGVHT